MTRAHRDGARAESPGGAPDPLDGQPVPDADAHGGDRPVPVPGGHLLLHDRHGRGARDLPGRLGDDRPGAGRIGGRLHPCDVRRVLHRVDAGAEHQHRVHALRVGVPHPGGPALRPAPQAGAPHPLRPRVVRRFEGGLGDLLDAHRRGAVPPVPAGARSDGAADPGLPVRHPRRVRAAHPLHVAVGHGHVLDHPGERTVRAGVGDRDAAVRSDRPARPAARMGAGHQLVPPVPVDLRVPDHRVGRPDRQRRAGRSGWACSCVWIVACAVAVRGFWRVSIRRYTAVGG